MSERPHKKLKLWEKLMSLVEELYAITGHFPAHEQYGLVAQMRRAAVSVASNIAEGSARKGKLEKVHFFTMAKGSLSELDA
ncbi:MAG: four helix bundle protein [Nitrospiraceae bacterium]|nr:four helix bundle protein [Nitrospiraceae bacterium]